MRLLVNRRLDAFMQEWEKSLPSDELFRIVMARLEARKRFMERSKSSEGTYRVGQD
jgi:hypothetical protein